MSTGHRIDRADLPTRGSNASLLGVGIGCLWVAGALGVLIYTFTSANLSKPSNPSAELATANAAIPAERTSK
jgi:hypothetical protein